MTTLDEMIQTATLVYVDGTQGWISNSNDEKFKYKRQSFITATGGTITTSGNFKIHTFLHHQEHFVIFTSWTFSK